MNVTPKDQTRRDLSTLSIEYRALGNGLCRCSASLFSPTNGSSTCTNDFDFIADPYEAHDYRWYTEEFLSNPNSGDLSVARRIAARLEESGIRLCERVFAGADGAQVLKAAKASRRLRVAINDLTGDATRLPWELMRSVRKSRPLSVQAISWKYVRKPDKDVVANRLSPGRITRVLLIISRPHGFADVAYRAVAKGLLFTRGLHVELTVLRPPTLRQLREVLLAARDAAAPYDIVHFDGHGVHENFLDRQKGKAPISQLLFARPPVGGSRGYLVFENPQVEQNLQFVDGVTLGDVLNEARVGALVLNSCRSATLGDSAAILDDDITAAPIPNFATSFADEACRRGVPLVVAMRFSVYADMARRYVDAFYRAVAKGLPADESAAAARVALYTERTRSAAQRSRQIEILDWWVPVAISTSTHNCAAPPEYSSRPAVGTLTIPSSIAEKIPSHGCAGVDNSILELERAFVRSPVVAVHGMIGSGKTALAAEFALWWRQTRGHTGSMQYTSFRNVGSLKDLVTAGASALKPRIQEAADVASGLEKLLDALSRQSLFWIWDDFEETARRSDATSDNAWTGHAPEVVNTLLTKLRSTGTKLLILTRQDRGASLGVDAIYVKSPEIAVEHAHNIVWLRTLDADLPPFADSVIGPILSFSAGNPRVITVMTDYAIRIGLRFRDDAISIVRSATEGTLELDITVERDAASDRSARNLLHTEFSDTERRCLSILFLFQEVVDTATLAMLGAARYAFSLPELATLDEAKARQLLDHCAALGLASCHSPGLYLLHPAFPGMLAPSFVQTFGRGKSRRGTRARRAFVEAMIEVARQYAHKYTSGARHFAHLFDFQFWNIANARHLAVAHGWVDLQFLMLSAIEPLYRNTSRWPQFMRLVSELEPCIINQNGLTVVKGYERQGMHLMTWLAIDRGRVDDLDEAVRWASLAVAVGRKLATRARRRGTITSERAASIVGALAHPLNALAGFERDRGNPECLKLYEELSELSDEIKPWLPERAGHLRKDCAFNLGMALAEIPGHVDLDAAERWIRDSLALNNAGDILGNGRCHGALGFIALSRYDNGGRKDASILTVARRELEIARDILPESALSDIAITQRHLGETLCLLRDIEAMSTAFRCAIAAAIKIGDKHYLRQMHESFADALAECGLMADAEAHHRIAAPFGDVPTVFVGNG